MAIELALAAGGRNDDRAHASEALQCRVLAWLPPRSADSRAAAMTASVVTLLETVGHVAPAAFRRQADSIARAARQVDSHDAMRLDERRVAPRHRRPEDGQDRRAHGRRQVHRSGVAGQQQSRQRQHAGEDDQIDAALET